MKDALQKLKDFHLLFDGQIPKCPTQVGYETIALRKKLLEEECEEAIDAMLQDGLAEVAKELADVIYVAIGTAVVYGIPIDKVFDAVHESNMAKAPEGVVKRRADGKVLKPDGWKAPDIKSILNEEFFNAR